jgi:hypothetical protein
MRVGDFHILATRDTYAVGKYTSQDMVHWVHAHVRIDRSTSDGAAIEIATPEILEYRDIRYGGKGQELATKSRDIVLNSFAGVMFKPLGIIIASYCGAFALAEVAAGPAALSTMRQVIVSHPNEVPRLISTGRLKGD